jgi:hypothetical protein
MINLMEELEKLMKEKPLPYGRKPTFKSYVNNGYYQDALIFCSPKSIIWKVLYRDECILDCFVLENDEWKDYQLDDILVRRVPNEKKDDIFISKYLYINLNFDERWLYTIKQDYYLLLQYGDDVLKGDLEWTRETRYPANRASQGNIEEMYAAFQKK